MADIILEGAIAYAVAMINDEEHLSNTKVVMINDCRKDSLSPNLSSTAVVTINNELSVKCNVFL